MAHCRVFRRATRVDGLRYREKGETDHDGAVSSSIGRTLTTFIMPACMW
jgi:hypothetical protein